MLCEVCFVYCSYADQLSACTRQVKWYIDSELSAVVGTTYHDLRQFVEAIDIATLFERSSARSHQSDIDVRESNLLHADQQVSGLCSGCFIMQHAFYNTKWFSCVLYVFDVSLYHLQILLIC